MWATARLLDKVSLLEEGVDLLVCEWITGFDGGPAGHRTKELVDHHVGSGGDGLLSELIKQVTHEGDHVGILEQRGKGVYRDRILLEDLARIERPSRMSGRRMTMLLVPK